jgi:hypothetical protein
VWTVRKWPTWSITHTPGHSYDADYVIAVPRGLGTKGGSVVGRIIKLMAVLAVMAMMAATMAVPAFADAVIVHEHHTVTTNQNCQAFGGTFPGSGGTCNFNP